MYLTKNRRNHKKSVLLVDDNKMMCQLTAKILEQNYTVHPFTSAIDAIQWLSESDSIPNVVVSDVSMSEMSGLEFGQYLKLNGLYSHIPLVYISGLPEDEVKYIPISVDYSAYTQKPFCPSQLLQTIENVTNQDSNKIQS